MIYGQIAQRAIVEPAGKNGARSYRNTMREGSKPPEREDGCRHASPFFPHSPHQLEAELIILDDI